MARLQVHAAGPITKDAGDGGQSNDMGRGLSGDPFKPNLELRWSLYVARAISTG